MFGKTFSSMYTGTMFGAGPHVFAVWGYAISNADRLGFVELNPLFLAAVLGTTSDTVQTAIDYLAAPDPRSRNKAEDGRRIVQEGAFLWRLVSYAQYRAIRDADERREYQRNLMAKRRAASPKKKRGDQRATKELVELHQKLTDERNAR